MRNIKVLSDRDHIYQKTEMYAGGVSEVQSTEYIGTKDGIRRTEVSYVPALLKIINEVIDNAVDVHIKTPTAQTPIVDVKMDTSTVTVKDNGCGIPVQMNEDGIYLPRVCWGFARSGGNFDLKENAGLGTFGVGSYITNVLSKTFTGVTCDGTNRYTIRFTDNAAQYKEAVTKSTERGTIVTFEPDLERFGLTEIGSVYMDLVQQRLLNLKMAFPQLTFKFNGKVIKVASFKAYCQQFNLPFELYEGENYSFAVMHNPEDDFQQFSYVNGLCIKDGGTHIDVIVSNVVDRLREKLTRKYKTIKPGDIRNKLFVVAFCRNFPNPKFNSQTKEKITNAPGEVSKYLDVPWDTVVQKIFKNAGVIDPITEVYKIKEEMKRRQELKSLSKVRKIKNEKYLPPTRRQKYLMIVEGECLEEHTKVMMETMDAMPIKDLQVGDYVLDRFMQPSEVQAITKLLKPVVKIKTGVEGLDVTCGTKHRFYCYNKATKQFCFKEAGALVPGEDCLVRSNINEASRGARVLENNVDVKVLVLEDDHVIYTENDEFVVMRAGLVVKVKGTLIQPDDVLVYTLV